jgi:hypothetical protein
MANRLFSPNQQYSDTTGAPYAGGSLTFYSSGTSTPLATYSNRALTIANTNPVVLDSAGRAGDIFLQNLAYKVVLCSDSLGLLPIWTADPVYASDFSTVASFLSGAGSPNGNTAGSQGSPTVPASVYWDTTNNILYVCTTTGTTTTAVWTAVNASTAAAVIPTPQGYLTLSSGVPIIPSDVSTGGVFYTPYVGNLVPIYTGSSFAPVVFTELLLTLNSSHIANNIYDVFIFNNSGVPTIVSGPSWSAGTGGNITAGSCARGTGAGGAALSRVNGIWTNTVQITGRNGATTYTINANLATYVGSILIDTVAGILTCHRLYGQSRKWCVWNAYNRDNIIMKAGDSTSSWVYNSGTVRAANGNSANSISTFIGLPEEQVFISEVQGIQNVATALTTTSFGGTATIGAGINSTTAFSGTRGSLSGGYQGASAIAVNTSGTIYADAVLQPGIGVNTITALEASAATAVSVTYQGTEPNMLLTAAWRG